MMSTQYGTTQRMSARSLRLWSRRRRADRRERARRRWRCSPSHGREHHLGVERRGEQDGVGPARVSPRYCASTSQRAARGRRTEIQRRQGSSNSSGICDCLISPTKSVTSCPPGHDEQGVGFPGREVGGGGQESESCWPGARRSASARATLTVIAVLPTSTSSLNVSPW